MAKILELRPDIKEENLSKCLTIIQQFLKTLMKSDVCKTAPHPSTEEGFKQELAWFLTRILEAGNLQSFSAYHVMIELM